MAKAKTAAQLDAEIAANIKRNEAADKLMTFYSQADAMEATRLLRIPARDASASIVAVPDRFGRGHNYRITVKGKTVTRAAYDRLMPREPKARPFYLTIDKGGRDVDIGEYRNITDAKAAARKLIASGQAKRVDVVERFAGRGHVQGAMSADGWSPV